MADRGLADTVVVDRTTGIAGAYAARLLADAGARVVRVEPIGGDPDRPTALWRFLHHDVESIETGDDTALASAIDAATIVLPSHGEHGLDELAHHRVVVAITPWGLEGPARDRPTNSFLLEAESGSLASRGRATRAPFAAGARTWEWITGGYAAAAAVAAVRKLDRTGQGELIDVSMFEATHLAGASFMPLLHQLAGRPAVTAPSRVIETPEIHPTLDGWVGFTTNSAQQFRDFLVMIDRADLVDDEELCAAAGRQRRYDEWTGIVDGWTSQRSTAEIVELARLLRIPVAPVLSPADVFDFDHFVARGVFVPSADGEFSMPRRPWRVVGEADGSRTRLSVLGEHRPFEPRRTATARPAASVAAGRDPRGRPDGVVGRAEFDPSPRLPRCRRHPRRIADPARRDADDRRGLPCSGRLVGTEFVLPVGQHQQARARPRSRYSRRPGRLRPTRRDRRHRRGELHPACSRQPRDRLGSHPAGQSRGPSSCGCRRSGSTDRGATAPDSPRRWSSSRAWPG